MLPLRAFAPSEQRAAAVDALPAGDQGRRVPGSRRSSAGLVGHRPQGGQLGGGHGVVDGEGHPAGGGVKTPGGARGAYPGQHGDRVDAPVGTACAAPGATSRSTVRTRAASGERRIRTSDEIEIDGCWTASPGLGGRGNLRPSSSPTGGNRRSGRPAPAPPIILGRHGGRPGMTTGGTAALVRRPDGSTRATLLELLFDVVFVASLALTSTLLAQHHSWSGTAMVLLMLTAIWWTWSVTSTTTEFYDPQQRPIQFILMVAMVGSVGMAASLPMVTDGHAMVFAVSYVGTHVIRGVVLVTSLHRQHHRSAMVRATRFLFWFVVSGVFWIAGGCPAR
ncbi:low temperature requirement protein A [Micromonospora sp. M12]